MNHNFKIRVVIMRAVILVLAGVGVISGYLLGRALAIQMADNSLDQSAKLMVAQEAESSVVARSLLEKLKGSPYPPCSEAEIAYLRELVVRSDYLKDTGRIQGGKIVCSATAGHPTDAMEQLNASSSLQDGIFAYSNLVPVTVPRLTRNGLQPGAAYVVFGSSTAASLGTVPLHRIATMKDDTSQQSDDSAGGASTEKEPDVSTEGMVRQGDTLYATRCSTVNNTCFTASTSVSEALAGEWMTLAGAMVLGGAFSALLGIVFSMMYFRGGNMEEQLRRAVAGGQLRVVYQPIVDLANGQIVGAEALSRWTNEEGIDVSPDVFIKIAEEHGFISEITQMVVKRTLRDFAETLISRPSFRVSVNVAGADLSDPDFLPMLDESVKRAKVSSKSLVLEITESSTSESAQAMDTIRALRHRGHSIHIDDFGTGCSNLDRMLCLWVDTIKIDKAFTRVIGTESVTVAILPQILEMAKSLNLEVVVEGVETDRQADYFSPSSRQRIFGQGWLYGRPVSAEEIKALLAGDRSPVAAKEELALAWSDGAQVLETPGQFWQQPEPAGMFIQQTGLPAIAFRRRGQSRRRAGWLPQ